MADNVTASTEILINHTPYETRVALLGDGVLQDIFVERERKRGIVGNIYKGKVQRLSSGASSRCEACKGRSRR